MVNINNRTDWNKDVLGVEKREFFLILKICEQRGLEINNEGRLE